MKIIIYNPYGISFDLVKNYTGFQKRFYHFKSVNSTFVDSISDLDLTDINGLLFTSGDCIIPTQGLEYIRNWVIDGGKLLLSAMGGDEVPHGYDTHRCSQNILSIRNSIITTS